MSDKCPLFKILLLGLCLTSAIIFAKNKYEGLLKESENLLYSNPERSLSILNYVYLNEQEDKVKARSLLAMAEIFSIAGKHHLAVQKLHEAKRILWENHDESIYLRIEILICKILLEQGFVYQARENFNAIKKDIGKNDDPDILFHSHILGLELIEKPEESLRKLKGFYKVKNFPKLNQLDYVLGNYFLTVQQPDSALIYFDKVIARSQGASAKDYFYYISALGKAKLLSSNELSDKTILFIENSLPYINISHHLPVRHSYIQFLTETYLKSGELEEFAKYNELWNATAKTASENKGLFRIYYFDFLENERAHLLSEKKTSRQNTLLGSGIFILILTLSVGGWYLKLNFRNKTLQQYDALKAKAIFSMPDRTEQQILLKLKKFEESENFTKPSVSLTSLAKDMGTNSSYLSEVINRHKKKNFNNYINELRINYITHKIRNNPQYLQFKTSYLAKEAGFNSRNSFTITFKSITGFSPSIYIEMVKNEKEL